MFDICKWLYMEYGCINMCVCVRVLCIIFEPYEYSLHFWHERATKEKAELGIASAAVSAAWAGHWLERWLTDCKKFLLKKVDAQTPRISSGLKSLLLDLFEIRVPLTICYLLKLKVKKVPQG